MSLVKFARCRNFLSNRRDKVMDNYLTRVPQAVAKELLQLNHCIPTDSLSKNHYATSVKPHMTPSMQKWKQKKRKSKAQQKKEMAKLHEDLVKLLSKRAIAFVKNKSFFEVHGGVVTTHVFTNFPHLEGSERSFSATGSSDITGLFPIDLRKHSSYVAEAMEAHLQNKHDGSNSFMKSYTGGIQKPNLQSTINSNVKHSSGVSYFPLKGDLHTSNNYDGVKDADETSKVLFKDLVSSSSVEHHHQPFSISVADVYNKSVKHSRESPAIHNYLDFQSNLKKFQIELQMELDTNTSNSKSTVHFWDNDINLEQEESNLTDNKAIKDPEVNKLSNSRRTKVKPKIPNISLQSNDLKLSDRKLQDEIESFRAEILESDMSIQAWDPYNSGISMIDFDGLHGDFEEYPAFNQAEDYSSQNAKLPMDFLHNGKFSIKDDSLADELWKNQSYVFPKHVPFNVNIEEIINKPLQQVPIVSKDKVPSVSKRSKGKKVKVSTPSQDTSVLKSRCEENEKIPKNKLRHINVNRELQELTEKSFVDVSCFTNSEMVAVRNLQYQASRQKLRSIEVFNKLIHSLAKKKDLQNIKSLFMVLKKQEIPPTLQTFAGCLECIGRIPDPDVKTCEKLLADISKKGLELKELANTCSFESDEWDYILKAIRLVHPDFVPNEPRLITQYDNTLLASLNVPNEQAMEKNQYAIDMTREEVQARAKAQLEVEKQGEIVIKSILAPTLQAGNDQKLQNMCNKVLEEWRRVLLQSFEQKLKVLKKKAHDNVSMTLYPYLKLFSPDEYVNIIFSVLKELMTSSEGYSPTQAFIQSNLGRAVNRKYNIDSKVASGMGEKILTLYALYMDKFLSKDYPLDNHRLMWLRSMNQNSDTINMDMSSRRWSSHIQKLVGKFLLDMILFDLKINANLFRPIAPERNVPAFCSIFRPDISLVTNAEIKMHPVVTKLFNFDSVESFTFDPSIVPMTVPPVPWISKNMGGLLLGSNSLIRLGPDIYHIDVLKNVTENQYPAVLDSLNTLSACAWRMNEPILDLQIQIFNNNGDARLKVSPPALEMPPMPMITEDMTSKDKVLLYRKRMELQQQKQDMHGLWSTDLYRLSIANKFRDDVFWFPHSMDFRGRTYPLPPHFNHLGSDNVRGMLLFAKGKPLGKDGYDWLKIHITNLTGFKKRCSNAKRLEFAQEIMDDILDSADKPLTGRKWWQTSDEPWQTLACCMEIAKIERFEGNKEDYICHFPVHQDGSCNGLQHYAALGRDKAGAESVNLHPFDTPKDVYSDVVELVEKTRQRDAEEGDETAKALEGFIKRKVIKQTIMTTVYGVTRFGAKLQIHRQLRDIQEIPPELAWKASSYLTDTTFNCLREMFTATKDIQDWLTESARLISAVVPVEWVTPLGFPVLQPYFKRINKSESSNDKFKPNYLKQKNAFPPNYIHSLDSTHMMLTSLNCMHAGTTFVSVHDCFWTHACDVSVMNKICREQFVNMHKQPLLEDLSEHLISVMKRAAQNPFLKEDIKNIDELLSLLRQLPKRGSFDLDNVLKSTYFFS